MFMYLKNNFMELSNYCSTCDTIVWDDLVAVDCGYLSKATKMVLFLVWDI